MRMELVERVRSEIPILLKEIGGDNADRNRVTMGKVTAGANDYLGVMVKSVGVDPAVFGGSVTVKLLVLLPPDYPATAPLGIYTDRLYKLVNAEHFTSRGHHGAPTINAAGWHWFCHGLGGFDASRRRRAWKPALQPELGHNLATVVAAARIAMGQSQ